ncbi:uncharacterized protein LOC107269608 isoform X4 [Cephus cinctus]|uniref:Uncharacterized protein LOC107269608 isoform X4 n=1 Tax=Cephus cinctus TaxID=211228 RepID=A0AAJ7RKK5_CEPCN|nr:uncharacterized protein LOC107269608 isoform X4 [Cephus cinctus]
MKFLMSQKRDELPSYNIGQWVQQLHLQQCAFVEIGENFCALFVELRSIPEPGKHLDNSEVGEFFLGLCTCETLRSWNLCSSNLANVRKSECTFAEAIATANTSARVHRRFCDVTLLANEAQVCNCTVPMAGEQLYRTEGFPTCFRNPLPTSICAPRGVCGVSRCTTITIRGIHSPRCDPDCHQRQPFCEEVGPWTSVPPVINSLWSHWSLPKCNNTCGMGMLMATALCRNLVTGSPATDCIGPGSFCCPNTAAQCICDVRISNGIMKAIRYTGSCTSTDGCDVNDVEDAEQGFEIPRDVIDQDYDKVDYPQNSPGEYLYAFEYEGTQKPVQRRLLGRYRNGYDDENLNLEELNMNFMEDKRHNQESSVNEEMADDSDDEADDEEDEDEDEDEDQRVNSTEGNQDYTDYDTVLVQQVDFLETILEETSDDLQSDSDRSGTTYWLGSDSETESVIHIRRAATEEKPDGSGSECNSVVPKKRRRKNPERIGAVACQDDLTASPRSSRSSSSTGSSSLLQFESLERTCATLSPSSYSFDSLEYSNRSNSHFENTSPDSLEQDYDRIVPNGLPGEKLNDGFGKIRPYRSFESLGTCQKEEDVREKFSNGFASLYSDRNTDLSRRNDDHRRDFWHQDEPEDYRDDREYDEEDEELAEFVRFEDRLIFGDVSSNYATSLDCRNTIDLREIGIETKRDAVFDLKSGQTSSSAALLQSRLNIASNMARTAGQQGWSKPRFNFRFTDKSQSVPSLPSSVFAYGFAQRDFSSTESVPSTRGSSQFENYTRVSSVPVDLHLCGTYTQNAHPPMEESLNDHEMADVGSTIQDDATDQIKAQEDGSAPGNSAVGSSVRTQDKQELTMVRPDNPQEERESSPVPRKHQVTSTVKTQDRTESAALEIAMAIDGDIDAVVDEAIKQFKREVEEATVEALQKPQQQRTRKMKNNASYELAQQFEIDERNFARMPSCKEVEAESSPKPAPRRKVLNNASYELAQQIDYIKAIQNARPFQRMDACDELDEAASSRCLKVTDLVEELSRGFSSNSTSNLATGNTREVANDVRTYSKSTENISTSGNKASHAQENHKSENHVGSTYSSPRKFSGTKQQSPSPRRDMEQDGLFSQIKKNSDLFSIYGESASHPVDDEVDSPYLENKPIEISHPEDGILDSAKYNRPADENDIIIDHKKTFIGEFYPEKSPRNRNPVSRSSSSIDRSSAQASDQEISGDKGYWNTEESQQQLALLDWLEDSKSILTSRNARNSVKEFQTPSFHQVLRESSDSPRKVRNGKMEEVEGPVPREARGTTSRQEESGLVEEEEKEHEVEVVVTERHNVGSVRGSPLESKPGPRSGNRAVVDTNRMDNEDDNNGFAAVREEMSASSKREVVMAPSSKFTSTASSADSVSTKSGSATPERKKGLGGLLQRFSKLRFSGRSKVPRSEVQKKSEVQVNRAKVTSNSGTPEGLSRSRNKEPDYIIIPLHSPEEQNKLRDEDVALEKKLEQRSVPLLDRSGSNVSTNGRPPVSSKPPLPPQPPRALALGARSTSGVATRRRAATDLGNPAAIEMAKARTMQAGSERPVGLLETDLDAADGSEGVSTPSPGTGPPGKKTRSLLNLNHSRPGREANEENALRAPQSPGGSRTPVDASVATINQRPHKSMEFLLDKENLHFVKPPENELQKVGERVPSEHELRVQRSLQRLNVPDWYKNSPAARDGFRLKRHSDASQHGGWRALGSKTTSLSSLSSSSNRQPTTGALLSPSPTPPVFSRWSTSLLNSAGSSPASSARSSFNHRQPYLGWRSQERLANPRTPAERLAQGILPQLQSANKQQQQHQQHTTNQQLEVRNSIKEVTSAIVHYVQSGQEVGGGGRLSPRPRPEDWDDRGGARSTSPRGSVKLCWMESSFVGSRPVDSPETPMSLATETECCAVCNATVTESCSCVDSATSGLYLDLTPTRDGIQEGSSLCPSPTSSRNYHHSQHLQQRHHRGSGHSDTEEAMAAAALLRNKPSPGSTTLEDVLDSLLGLPSASRTPSPGPGPGSGSSIRHRSNVNASANAGKSCSDLRQDLQAHEYTPSGAGTCIKSEGTRLMSVAESVKHEGNNQEERASYYVGELLVRRKSEGSDTIPTRAVAKASNLRHRRVSFDSQENGTAEKIIRCRNNKCTNSATAAEAKKIYKSCHNCTCLYCSRECRRAHWQRHRRTCLYSRAGALCREVLSSAKEDQGTLGHVSALARRGYASHGRGAVKCFFSSPEAAEKFIENGFVDLGEPTYVRWSDLLPSEMGAELFAEVMKLCKSYNPDTRLVLYVAVCVVSEVPTSGAVKWERQLVSRCAKLRLDAVSRQTGATVNVNVPSRQTASSPCNITREMDSPETLVLTSFPGSNGQNTPQRAREISFTNIQRQLRLRGVSLRRHFPQVYKKLCSYVDGSVDKFAPVTIYPRDQASGKSFMCIIMLDAEPERLQLLPTDSSRVRTVDISIEQE